MTHMMRQKAHELQILWDSQGRRLWCQQCVCVDSQHSSAAPWEDAWCFPWVIAASSSHLRHDAPRTWPLEETELKLSLRILFQSWNNQVVYIIFILHRLRYLFYAGLSHIALYYCYSCLLRRYLLYISGIFVFLNTHTHTLPWDLASSYTDVVTPRFSGAVTDLHSIHLICMMTRTYETYSSVLRSNAPCADPWAAHTTPTGFIKRTEWLLQWAKITLLIVSVKSRRLWMWLTKWQCNETLADSYVYVSEWNQTHERSERFKQSKHNETFSAVL